MVQPTQLCITGLLAEWRLLKADNEQITTSRHSGAGRTKARSALNAHRAARRVSEANNPGNEATVGAAGSRPAPG